MGCGNNIICNMAKLSLVALLCLSAMAIGIEFEFTKNDEWSCDVDIVIDSSDKPAGQGLQGGFLCFIDTDTDDTTKGVTLDDPGFMYIGTLHSERNGVLGNLTNAEFFEVMALETDPESDDYDAAEQFESTIVLAREGVPFSLPDGEDLYSAYDYSVDYFEIEFAMDRYNLPDRLVNAGSSTTENPNLICYYRQFSNLPGVEVPNLYDLKYWSRLSPLDIKFDSTECVNEVINLPRFQLPDQPLVQYRVRSEFCPSISSDSKCSTTVLGAFLLAAASQMF